MSTNESTIRITAGDIQIESTGTAESHGDRMREALRALRETLPELTAGEPERTATVRQLLDRSVARSYGEKAGVVAYWLQTHGGRKEWRSREIVEQLVEAGEPEPSNITEALNAEKKKGLFESKDRLWRLTERGLGWVEYGLGVCQDAG